MHRRSLARFPFDSVLLPYNFRQMQDERYAEEFEALAAVCAKSGVAIQTIESIARPGMVGRRRRRPGTNRSRTRRISASQWSGVLGRDDVFLNTVGDVTLLPLVLAAAEEVARERPSDDRMNELAQRQALKPLFV